MSDTLRCPVVNGVSFNPVQPDQILDPYPWLRAAREKTPVFYIPELSSWFVTRYEDVLSVLRDTKTFSSEKSVEVRPLPDMEARLPGGHPIVEALVNTDPPAHTRMRRLAQLAFTPKMVDSYEPSTRDLANELLDEIIEAGSTNIIQTFTRRFTGTTLTNVIGVPRDKAADFIAWSDKMILSMVGAPPLAPEEERALIDEAVYFNGWLMDFIEDRRANPRGDYTSHLTHARDGVGEGSALTTNEVVRVLASVISAGLDTSSSLLGLSLYQLLGDRDLWNRLLEDRSLVPAAIEEVLRFDGPVRATRRTATVDTEVGGVPIAAGSKVHVLWSSANRDESVFDHADVFDMDREDVARHLGFGRWTHFCIGAPLARMEVKVGLETLLARIPSLRLAPDPNPEILTVLLGAFFTRLDVEWDLVPSAAETVGAH